MLTNENTEHKDNMKPIQSNAKLQAVRNLTARDFKITV